MYYNGATTMSVNLEFYIYILILILFTSISSSFECVGNIIEIENYYELNEM